MIDYFVLVDKIPVQVEFTAWAEKDPQANVVKQEVVNGKFVSTILIGIGQVFTNRPYFETMIFCYKENLPRHELYQKRCATYEQAEEQHAEAVLVAKGEQSEQA